MTTNLLTFLGSSVENIVETRVALKGRCAFIHVRHISTKTERCLYMGYFQELVNDI